MSATLLHSGYVFTNGQIKPAEVFVDGGRIQAVAPHIDAPQATQIDMTGLILSPGFVDLHVHLREPGFSQKETIASGTKAAAAGGFTTVCAMPNLRPVPDSRIHLEAELACIRSGARIEVLPYGAITVDEAGQTIADLEDMAPDCIGFSDDGKGVQSEARMTEAMRRIASLNRLLSAHCEDESLLLPGGHIHKNIPGESEWRQVQRDIALVAKTGVRYHVCHISTKETVALLREAKVRGLPVSGECTPHQLALCEEDITEDDGRFKMNPPLRTRADQQAIIEGLLDGTIDCIATDHAPHTDEEKAKGLAGSAFGIVGLETAFAACYTALVLPGLCTLPFLLTKLTSAPARIIGREAMIAPGEPANLTALDMQKSWKVNPNTFYTLGRSTPLAGQTLTGQVVATWYQGTQVFQRGDMQ